MAVRGAEFQLDDVSVRFRGFDALSGVCLHVSPGEAVGLLGPSGAGKTTLLRLLNGSLRPTSGYVRIDGEPVCELSRRELRQVRAAIGFVRQDLCLIPNLRVSKNVIAGKLGQLSFVSALRTMLLPPISALEPALALLDRVGIADKLFERTDRLSGGEQQRVAIARALYQNPEALLADEPVASVDPARARDTVALLARISREEEITLCMTLHRLELAREFFPRLIGLRGGRIVFDRKSTEVDDSDFDALYDLDPGACGSSAS